MLVKATQCYMYSVFNQNWKVFAPEPPLFSRKILYNCLFKDGQNTGWVNPGAEDLQHHISNRFGNYGKKYALYESIARELDGLYQESSTNTRELDIIPQTVYFSSDSAIIQRKEFLLAKRFIMKDVGKKYADQPILTIQFVLLFEHPPRYESRKDESASIQRRVIVFPPASF